MDNDQSDTGQYKGCGQKDNGFMYNLQQISWHYKYTITKLISYDIIIF